jgi:hypothetical protein
MPKSVYKAENVTVLWNQAVHTDRKVTAHGPDIIIKNKKRLHVTFTLQVNLADHGYVLAHTYTCHTYLFE